MLLAKRLHMSGIIYEAEHVDLRGSVGRALTLKRGANHAANTPQTSL